MASTEKYPQSAEEVDARATDAGLACGSCGQGLPLFLVLTAAELEGDADAVFNRFLANRRVQASGYRFDGCAWRPTRENRARWARALKVVREPHRYSAAEVAAARRGLARGGFWRREDASEDRKPVPATQESSAHVAELPTRFECIRCSAVNRVAAPEPTRRAVVN